MAIDWLEKAYKERSPNLHYITEPVCDPLLSYPRFQALLPKMNLLVDMKK
jgi:hypothetical protein